MDQKQLDKATEQLAKLKRLAGEWADEACKEGDAGNSARLRRAEGYLALALAEGRCISGGIQPQFGGK